MEPKSTWEIENDAATQPQSRRARRRRHRSGRWMDEWEVPDDRLLPGNVWRSNNAAVCGAENLEADAFRCY